ncbi:MAG: hypothetical protein OEV40_08625 [Acidimicrobiia bacterium]|nr:hypothetical protein [Acidimicrobiia bacterium]
MPARLGFSDDLESLRLQVEVMALLVADSVTGARRILDEPNPEIAAQLVEADDAIDEMHVSLLEQCYTMLAREAPVASDLRLIVSVIRVLHELERIGDLALRVAKAVDDIPLVACHPEVFEVLRALADNVAGRFLAVQRGWSAASLEPLAELDDIDPLIAFADPLVSRLMALSGDDAVRVALAAMGVGRSFDRIGDHTEIMASRLRYLVTGDPSYLAYEVTW